MPGEHTARDLGGFRKVSELENGTCTLFEVEQQVLALTFKEGLRQDKVAAEAILALASAWVEQLGVPCGVIIFSDAITEQDARARRVFTRKARGDQFFSVALIARSLFARAAASFYMGIARPVIPTKVFNTFDEAVAWTRQMRDESASS